MTARALATSTCLAAVIAGAGCSAILGIHEPGDPAPDAALAEPLPTGASPAQPVDAAAQLVDTATEHVDATEGASDVTSGEDVEPPDGGAGFGGLDALATATTDADAAPNLNPCANAFDGAYCGSDGNDLTGFDTSGTDRNTLYTCTNGATTSAVVCPDGCMVHSVLQDDTCAP